MAGRAWWADLFPLTSVEIPEFDLLTYLNRGGLPVVYQSDEYIEGGNSLGQRLCYKISHNVSLHIGKNIKPLNFVFQKNPVHFNVQKVPFCSDHGLNHVNYCDREKLRVNS